MLFINRHSFLLVGIFATGAAGLIALRGGFSAASLAIVAATLLALIALFWRFNAGASTVRRDLDLDRLLIGSLPTLVELQSPY